MVGGIREPQLDGFPTVTSTILLIQFEHSYIIIVIRVILSPIALPFIEMNKHTEPLLQRTWPPR